MRMLDAFKVAAAGVFLTALTCALIAATCVPAWAGDAGMMSLMFGAAERQRQVREQLELHQRYMRNLPVGAIILESAPPPPCWKFADIPQSKLPLFYMVKAC